VTVSAPSAFDWPAGKNHPSDNAQSRSLGNEERCEHAISPTLAFPAAEHLGWRGALLVYAGSALTTVPLHLAVPKGRYEVMIPSGTVFEHRPLAATKRQIAIGGALYAVIATLANFLNSGMSSHMIGILTGLGLAASASVWVATLRGIGQSLARLCEVAFGRRIDPLTLNLLASLLLPFCFIAGLFSGQSALAALAVAFFYGAGNGDSDNRARNVAAHPVRPSHLRRLCRTIACSRFHAVRRRAARLCICH
jgi:hypothetical protein